MKDLSKSYFYLYTDLQFLFLIPSHLFHGKEEEVGAESREEEKSSEAQEEEAIAALSVVEGSLSESFLQREHLSLLPEVFSFMQ